MPQLADYSPAPAAPLPFMPPVDLPVASADVRRASLWHGPGAAGSLGGVTQSMLQKYLCCRERFRVQYVLGLKALDRWNPHSGFGNQWHLCEEHHAANKDWRQPLEDYVYQQMHTYPMQRPEIQHWSEVCRVQFPEYVKHWEQHPDVLDRQPLMQEQVFDVPHVLPSGRTVRLRGKYDSVDLIPSQGGVLKQENKTKSDVDEQSLRRQMTFDLQTMVYRVSLDSIKASLTKKKVGDMLPWEAALASNTICGTRYNVVLRQVTIRPHAAKTKRGKHGRKTKPDEPDQHVPAESSADYYERLRRDYYAAEPSKYFFRLLCRVSQKDVEVFRQQCLDPVLENLADDYAWWDWCLRKDADHWDAQLRADVFPIHTQRHFRFPYGVYNALQEGGYGDVDNYLDGGGEAGLRRVDTLFDELKEQSCP